MVKILAVKKDYGFHDGYRWIRFEAARSSFSAIDKRTIAHYAFLTFTPSAGSKQSNLLKPRAGVFFRFTRSLSPLCLRARGRGRLPKGCRPPCFLRRGFWRQALFFFSPR